jgi:hypothetical protein
MNCQEMLPISAHGLCEKCYQQERRAIKRKRELEQDTQAASGEQRKRTAAAWKNYTGIIAILVAQAVPQYAINQFMRGLRQYFKDCQSLIHDVEGEVEPEPEPKEGVLATSEPPMWTEANG